MSTREISSVVQGDACTISTASITQSKPTDRNGGAPLMVSGIKVKVTPTAIAATPGVREEEKGTGMAKYAIAQRRPPPERTCNHQLERTKPA